MRIRRRIGKKHIWILMSSVLIAVSAGITIFTILRYKKTYEGIAVESEEKLDSMKKQVFAAAVDIKKGDMITADNVYKKEIIISDEGEIWIDMLYLNQLAGVDIEKDMFITKNMIFETMKDEEGFREVYIDNVNITPNISPYDYCDIRIVYPNGESYIMLSKKQIYAVNEAYNAFCLKLNPEEYHLFLSGITDCKDFKNSVLVITKYIDSNEVPSVITYQPTEQSLALIYNESKEDKRIGKHYSTDERNELVKRLTDYTLNHNLSALLNEDHGTFQPREE